MKEGRKEGKSPENVCTSNKSDACYKVELPHPVYACVFRIALRFTSNYLAWFNQGNYLKNAMLCGKLMRNRDV